VEILPTTLFGQKFIQFVPPETPSGQPLEDGAVIEADRVETNVELSKVLTDLFPLLRAVQPADLNATLNALATALEGRGEQLGETADDLGQYLDAIDQELPTLREDLVELAEVADAYDVAAPDLLDVLDNVTVTSKTLVEKRQQLDVFFSDLGGLADTSTRILRDNEQNLVRVGQVTEPILALLADYSPEFPCLIKGAANYAPILSRTFEGDWVKQYIEFFNPQWRVFDERDKPRYGEVGHGPWCAGLPKFTVPGKHYSFDQGSDLDENLPRSPVPNFGVFPPDWLNLTSGYAGTDAEKQIVNTMLASESGGQPSDYGALGSLLYGPVVREGRAKG
jgi:phospholipid/cholesterol/gamma-HCH transport system substrate-binding protein